MGMYTELHYNVRLREDTPSNVIGTLQAMVGGTDQKSAPFDHPLFKSDGSRWGWMLKGDSYYFDADTRSTLRFDDIVGQYYLCVRCNIKNYSREIQNFCDWLDPYVDANTGDFLGFSRYEESEDPDIIRKK